MALVYRSVFTGIILFALHLMTADEIRAQIQEPEPLRVQSARTPLDEGLRSGIGFNTVINNFGFGLGVEYKRVLAHRLEGVATFRWTGLRDVTEQTFTDIFFGQQTIPNKYRRAFAFPMTVGIRQRVFADQVSDDYRFFVSGAVGPVLSFSYPYFNDINNNGYREQFQQFYEESYDVFTGLGEGDWHLGLAGELKLSLDVGQNFARLTTIQFGYLFYYFDQGIQMMQPNQPVRRTGARPGEFPYRLQPEECTSLTAGCELEMQSFFSPQRFFGTPQISLVFGRMW